MKTYEEYIELANDSMLTNTERMLVNADIYIENATASLQHALCVISDIDSIYQESMKDKYEDDIDSILFEANSDSITMTQADKTRLQAIKYKPADKYERKAVRRGYVTDKPGQRTSEDISEINSYAFKNIRPGSSSDYYSKMPVEEPVDPKEEVPEPVEEDKGIFKTIAATIAAIIKKVLDLFKSKEAQEEIKEVQIRAKRLSDLVKEANIGAATLVVPDDTTISNKYHDIVGKAIKLINKYKKRGYRSRALNPHVDRYGNMVTGGLGEWSFTLIKEIDEFVTLAGAMQKRYTKPGWRLDTDHEYQFNASKRGIKIAKGVLEKNVNITVNAALSDLTSSKTAGIIDNITKDLEVIEDDMVNVDVIRAFADMYFYEPGYLRARKKYKGDTTAAQHFSSACAKLCSAYYRFIFARNRYYLLLITDRLKEAGVKPSDITVVESVKRDMTMYDKAAKNFTEFVRGTVNSYYDFLDSRDALYTEASGFIEKAAITIKKIINAIISFVTDLRYRMSSYIAGVRFRSYMKRIKTLLTEDPNLKNMKVTIKDYSKVIPELEKARKMLDVRIDAFRKITKNNATILDSPDVSYSLELQELEKNLKILQKNPDGWMPNWESKLATATTIVVALGTAYYMLDEHSRNLDKEMVEVLSYSKSLDSRLDTSVGIPRRSAECGISLAEEGAMIVNARSRTIIGRLQSLVASIMSALTPGDVMDNSEVAAITGAKFESTLSSMEKELFAEVYKEALDEATGSFREEDDDDYDDVDDMDGEMDSDDEQVPGDMEADSYLNGMVDSLSEEDVEDYDPMRDIF